MFKKGLSWLLALSMVIALIPVTVLVTAFAESTNVAEYNADGTVKSELTDAEYIKSIQDKLLKGESVTLERDLVITDFSNVYVPKLTSNRNGQYGISYGEGAIFYVIGEDVTFDLNGHSIIWDAHDETFCQTTVALFRATVEGAQKTAKDKPTNFTIVDSSEDKSGSVAVYGYGTSVYSTFIYTTVNVSGGTWTNYPCKECGKTSYFIYPSHGSAMNITNGTFQQITAEGKENQLLGWQGSTNAGAQNYLCDYSKTQLNIFGGTFIDFNPEQVKFIDYAGSDKKEINGCAKGFSVKCANGTYFVVKDPVAIGEETFASLSEALAVAKAGDTIELLADVTISSKFIVDKSVSINGNGYKIVADPDVTWYKTVTNKFGTRKDYPPHVVITADDVLLKNVIIEANGVAGGVKVEGAEGVVFDTVSVLNTMNSSITVDASSDLTFKNYLKIDGTTQTKLSISGEAIVAEGTLFEIPNYTANLSPSTNPTVAKALNTEGEPFFMGYSSTTYYVDFNNVSSMPSSLTLLKDAAFTSSYTISKEYTLNLNGHTLTIPEGKALNVSTVPATADGKGAYQIIGDGDIIGQINLTQAGAAVAAPETLSVNTTVDGHVVLYFASVGIHQALPSVELPEALIKDITNSLDDLAPALSFALNFTIKDFDVIIEDEDYVESLMNVYGDAYVDYYIKIEGLNEEQVIFNGDGKKDGYLSGQYDAWSENWITVPFEDVAIKNGESLYLMKYAGENISSGLRQTFAEIAYIVQDFDCGIYFSPEFLANNPDMKVTLGLQLFWEDANGNKDVVVNLAKETFYAKRAANYPNLPEVQITDIIDNLDENAPDLSYALNFTIKDFETIAQDQAYIKGLMALYGDAYVDYALTISGLTDEKVVFNADGTADGYLAGQYDAFGDGWLSVPFDNVELKNGESLYLMKYAADSLNQPGLRFTFEEVAVVVQNFDCGMYFTPEFLAANPNMKITLALHVFRENESGEIIDLTVAAENEYLAKNAANYPADFEIGRSAQVRLIEPWGLKANFMLKMNGQLVDYSALKGYKVYFVRQSAFASGEEVTIQSVLANAKTSVVTRDLMTIESDNDGNVFLSAIYDKELYTYQFSDTIYILLCTEDENGIVRYDLSSRNMSQLVNDRKDSNKPIYTEYEKAVYAKMAQLEKDILAYRSSVKDADKLTAGDTTPLLFEKHPLASGAIYDSDLNGAAAQIRLIEPWGLRLSAMFLDENKDALDYSTYKEIGAVVYVDKTDKLKGNATLEQILSKGAYVYSSANGNVTIDEEDGSFSVVYTGDIYTYELDTDVYVVFYLMDDAGNCTYGKLINRNIYDLMCSRKDSSSDVYKAEEKAVYADMIELYNAITAYRNDIFENKD